MNPIRSQQEIVEVEALRAIHAKDLPLLYIDLGELAAQTLGFQKEVAGTGSLRFFRFFL